MRILSCCQACSRSCTSIKNWWKCTLRFRSHGALAKNESISIDLPAPQYDTVVSTAPQYDTLVSNESISIDLPVPTPPQRYLLARAISVYKREI